MIVASDARVRNFGAATIRSTSVIRDARREAAREARVRRELRSSGYTLRKSRRADSAGTYAVIDPFRR